MMLSAKTPASQAVECCATLHLDSIPDMVFSGSCTCIIRYEMKNIWAKNIQEQTPTLHKCCLVGD